MTSPPFPTPPSKRLPRLPFLLLGLMTVFSFGGPIAIGAVLRGGASPAWPPDRPVEWATLVGISGMVVLLMVACCSLALVNRKGLKGEAPGPRGGSSGVEP